MEEPIEWKEKNVLGEKCQNWLVFLQYVGKESNG